MPYVLVAAAILWPNAVRLCRAFREVGFEVGAIAVPQHPVHRSNAPDRTFEYRPKAPLDSLREAIAERRPDIIVPCDDRIVSHLCALRALGEDNTSTLIETSLGLGGASGVLAKRATLGEISRLPDVDVPRTDSIASVSDLRTWVRKFGLPAILKLDGSWGGNDVVVVRHELEIRRAFWAMRFRQSVLRSVKHYVTGKDVEALSRLRSAISVQSFVPGKLANATVACWRGKVLAQVAVEVVELASPLAPRPWCMSSMERRWRPLRVPFVVITCCQGCKALISSSMSEAGPPNSSRSIRGQRRSAILTWALAATWRQLCSRLCPTARQLGGHLFNPRTFLSFRANGVATRKVRT